MARPAVSRGGRTAAPIAAAREIHRHLDCLVAHLGDNAAAHVTRIEIQTLTDIQERKRLFLIMIEEPILRVLKKSNSNRHRFVAIFKNTFNGVAKNCQHEFLLWFQISRPAKNLPVLLRRDDISLKKTAGIFHVASPTESAGAGDHALGTRRSNPQKNSSLLQPRITLSFRQTPIGVAS